MLWHAESNWLIGAAADLGQNRGWVSLFDGCLRPEASTVAWEVWDGAAWVDAPELRCLAGSSELQRPLATVVQPQKQLARGARGEICEVNGLAVNKSHDSVYSAAGDGNGYAWDAATLQLKRTLAGHSDYLHCVGCYGDHSVVTGGEDGQVLLWDARGGQAEQLLQERAGGAAPPPGKKAWIGALDVDQEGGWVAAGGGGNSLWLWHIASRRLVAAMPTCGAVQVVSFCADRILSAGAEPAIYQWSRSGKLVNRVPTSEPSTFALAHRPFSDSSDSRILVAGGSEPRLPLYYRAGLELGFFLGTPRASPAAC